MTEEEIARIDKQFRRLPAIVRNHIDRLAAAQDVPEENRYHFIKKLMNILQPATAERK